MLHDVLARLDQTSHAFFRRVANSETSGFPRSQGCTRYHSFTYKEYGNGAHLDNGSLVPSTSGRLAVHWPRPRAGTITTVTIRWEADGWYVSISCAAVPTAPLPRTGEETGSDVGLQNVLVTADGAIVARPRHARRAERAVEGTATRLAAQEGEPAPQEGDRVARQAAAPGASPASGSPPPDSATRLRHQAALALVRQDDVIYVEAIQPANLSRRPAAKPDSTGGDAYHGDSRKAGRNTSIRDAEWGHFLTLAACKAAWAGERVAAVDPAYTSQDCSGCGEHIERL
jgi:putative transposase